MYPFLKRLFRPLLGGSAALLTLLIAIQPMVAQDTSNVVDFVGTVDAVAQNTLIVNQVIVDMSNVTPTASLQIGMTVRVRGNVQNNIVIATTIEITTMTLTPAFTPTPTLTTTQTPPTTPTPTGGDVVIVIEGPIQKINLNIITIYSFDINVEVNHPILLIVKVGDVVRVDAHRDTNGVLFASTINNILDPTNSAAVRLSGNVQTITNNIVTINGVNVQFEPDDPILASLHIGDPLSVEGNFHRSGNTTIVIIVVNIFFNNVTNVTISLPTNCKITKHGHVKCSKKSNKHR